MKTKTMTAICGAMIITTIATPSIWAAGKDAAPETQLPEAAQKLEALYAGQLEALQAEISKALPAVDAQKNAAYLKTREAEGVSKAGLDEAEKRMGELTSAQGSVGHAKGKWIGGADKGIAESTEKLKKATTDAERKTAQEELAKWQKNREDGLAALKERQAVLDKATAERPEVEKQFKKAEEALAHAKAAAMKASDGLGLGEFLAGDKLDAKFAKFQVLTEATPRGLAEYAQQGKAHEALINKLLADNDLMIQMAVAGGAKNGNYGRAMEIYTEIQKASKKAGNGVLQRLALATSLEHAVPVTQRNAVAKTDAPATVDPVQRYLHFEKACLDGELDSGFEGLGVWEYRMAVNGEEPDEILTWGREMLRNYRPDHISTTDYRWRYVALVRSDIKYGSQDNQYDEDDLQFFQNILKNGGVCGRRAFIGRFTLRAFGIPTVARPQRGHAALAHWTPDGWVVCLGGGWGVGWANGPEEVGRGRAADTIFLAQTQARMAGAPYKQVWRAKTAASALVPDDASGLWDSVALYRQRAVIQDAQSKTLAAVGEDIGEANETKEKVDIAKVTLTDEDRKVAVDGKGVITIPASATSTPTQSTGKIIFMPSNLGGKQLHYSRTGDPENFEYTFEAPAAGKYALTARVVTPSWKQHLQVAVNAKEPTDIALPFTVGKWDTTQPVEITLAQGENVLRFSRDHEGLKGLTIRDFTLTPVK